MTLGCRAVLALAWAGVVILAADAAAVAAAASDCPQQNGSAWRTQVAFSWEGSTTSYSGGSTLAADAAALRPIGQHKARIPEASDAGSTTQHKQDGQDGDVAFQFGNLKPLATVGEVDYKSGTVIVGVPDGNGAYLVDDATVRLVVQGESYGPIAQQESYPYLVNDGAAAITGSHVQYVDYDRQLLSSFMTSSLPASSLVKGAGEVIRKMYNLRGQLVQARNRNGPTSMGAFDSNVDADGNMVVAVPQAGGVAQRESDWTMQSLCSAHLAERELWGAGLGFVDDIFLTNEEWITVQAGQTTVGLPAHAVDLATGTSYAWAPTVSGFEKTVNFNSGDPDYVVVAISGYNGALGNTDAMLERRRAMGMRPDGNNWTWPRDICPTRIYVGRKGFDAMGNPNTTGFLERNGLAYGQMYGFAVDSSATGFAWRDAWHRSHYNGDSMTGKFLPISWRWNGTVTNFEHDGAWHWQIPPVNAPTSDWKFWNAAGNDQSGSKTEHASPDPHGASAFFQTSTAGYFGKYVLDGLAQALAAAKSQADPFPPELSATYHLYQGETDVNHLIDLGTGGKGQCANGQNQTVMCDRDDQCTAATPAKSTFEDVDGFEALSAPGDRTFSIVQEDGGNRFGERMFLYENLLTYGQTPSVQPFKFVAQSGGKFNSRMLAGVSVPAGTSGPANSHEFSGISDLSGFFVKSGSSFSLTAAAAGYQRKALEKTVPIDDKLILINLQAHSLEKDGVIKQFNADRGGQWLLWKPNIAGDGSLPTETAPSSSHQYTCNPFTTEMCYIHESYKVELMAACRAAAAETKPCPSQSGSQWKEQVALSWEGSALLYQGTSTLDADAAALRPIGHHKARIPEASDAGADASLKMDGQDGDVAFQFGNLKPLATVGEVDYRSGMVVAGVPDGNGAMLADDDTVRLVVQSESYGPITAWESYPYLVNDGAVAITGSHVQYIDYDRELLSTFMTSSLPASSLVKGAGEVIQRMYNLRGQLVGPRSRVGPTTMGAFDSNVDADGNLVVATPALGGVGGREADWTMMSLCSAHLAEKELWGAGLGFVDDIFLTNEEWITVKGGQTTVGLPAHAVDLATKTAYAWAPTVSGFEKTVNFNSGHADYVVIAISGYNGALGGDVAEILGRRQAMGTRPDGSAWVWPRDICPTRIYVGRKGYDAMGNPSTGGFLERNGLAYGQMYGFAVDSSATGFAWRDAWHRSHYNGDTMTGKFLPISWRWNGTVLNFEHDGAWHWQIAPVNAPTADWKFWNAAGNDQSGSKTEHASPDPHGDSAFFQTSTAGYFGKYVLDGLATALNAAKSQTDPFPSELSATYHLYQGETDVNHLIDLGTGGKGQCANGQNQTVMCDRDDQCVNGAKTTFEDVDGFEALSAPDGKTFSVVQEDGGNRFGERMFLYENLLTYGQTPAVRPFKFVAQSGGKFNSRMLAGASVPAGTSGSANSHEFSGITDLSGFFAKSGSAFSLKAADAGHQRKALEKTVAIDDKLILINLQAHSLNTDGVIKKFNADRGGQWLLWKPNTAGDGSLPQESMPDAHAQYPCNPYTSEKCYIHPTYKAQLDGVCGAATDVSRASVLRAPILRVLAALPLVGLLH